MASECPLGWELDPLCGQPVPGLSLPHIEVFPAVQDKAPKFLLVTIAPGLLTGHHWQKLGSCPLLSSCPSGISAHWRHSPKPSLLQTRQPQHCARSCSHQHSPSVLHDLLWMRLTPGHTTATCHIPKCWFVPRWAWIWMLSMWGSSVLHYQEDQLSVPPGSNFFTAVGEKKEKGQTIICK